MDDDIFIATGPIWQWQSANGAAGSWYFLKVDAQTATEIRYAALGRIGGFGSVKVQASIGRTSWNTSLFPHRETGGFLLPLKADVRRREALATGDQVTAQLRV